MTNKSVIELVPGRKHFFYYPTNVAIVGVSASKVNFMPCAWNTGLSYDPFLYGVSIGIERATRSFIDEKKEFSVNFVDFHQHHLIRSLGRSSGLEINKVKHFDVKYTHGEILDCPILECAYLSYECSLHSRVVLGDHVLYVGEAKLMHVNNDIRDETIVDTSKTAPLLYLGVDHYLTTDPSSLKNLKDLPFHYTSSKK